MKLRTARAGLSALLFAASASAALAQEARQPSVTSVQAVPVPSVATARRVVAVQAGTGVVHRYFGSLVSVNGEQLTIELRDGRLMRVDATRAFALNRVSEPLFHGKPTVVVGTFGPGGVFLATVVKRGAPLPTNWGADR